VVEARVENASLIDLRVQAAQIGFGERFLTFFGVAAALALLVWVLRVPIPKLILGADNRYSKSKFQLLVWFGVVITAFLSTLLLRFLYSDQLLLGTVSIPKNLLTLSGLSALTFVSAKAITQSKQNNANAKIQAANAAAGTEGAKILPSAGLQRPEAVVLPLGETPLSQVVLSARPTEIKTKAEKPSFPSDLTQDDGGNPDLGDFQMVLITLVGALIYVFQVFSFLGHLPLAAGVSLPEVDLTLLGILGLGQATYALKNQASDPTPPSGPKPGSSLM